MIQEHIKTRTYHSYHIDVKDDVILIKPINKRVINIQRIGNKIIKHTKNT